MAGSRIVAALSNAYLGLLLVTAAFPLSAQESLAPITRQTSADDTANSAIVSVDGQSIATVRGTSSYPARERAERFRRQIEGIAADRSVAIDDGRIVSGEGRVTIVFGDYTAMTLFDADAELESITLDLLAEATLVRLRRAIEMYRDARSPRSLLRSTAIFTGVTVSAATLLFLVFWLFRSLDRVLGAKVMARVQKLDKASPHRVLDTELLARWFKGLLRALRFVVVAAIVLTWLSVSLGVFPWTRPFASSVYGLVLDPLRQIGLGIVAAIPDIVFIVVLAFVVRFILRIAHTFFDRVDRGLIQFPSFDRDWAIPSYRILRVLVIAFAVVVAYPYIPGSHSDAFKGVSLFLGVIFSIGSSSFIANIIAGYTLTYRRAFRTGDRVRVGELTGDVLETRAFSTRLRSPKNEEIDIPNAQVLSSDVLNYSSLAREGRLILHTRVGIGYDTPWRQVEGLLLLAAARTEGIAEQPAPFVLQVELGDFACVYELNAYCSDARAMARLYSGLHANIQDAFNEYNVQIMSPHYEQDPDQPKIVAPPDWYLEPAVENHEQATEK